MEHLLTDTRRCRRIKPENPIPPLEPEHITLLPLSCRHSGDQETSLLNARHARRAILRLEFLLSKRMHTRCMGSRLKGSRHRVPATAPPSKHLRDRGGTAEEENSYRCLERFDLEARDDESIRRGVLETMDRSEGQRGKERGMCVFECVRACGRFEVKEMERNTTARRKRKKRWG